MNKWVLFTFVKLSLGMSSFNVASAAPEMGVGAGGGGNAVVCRNEKNEVISARFYDLFEGQFRRGFSYPNATTTHDSLMVAMSSYSRIEVRERTKEEINRIVANIKTISGKYMLEPSKDFGSQRAVVVPMGCHLEGVGYYEADGTLMVSGDVYRAFASVDRAAFLLHEAIYKMARTSGAETSENVRPLVALLFSGNGQEIEKNNTLYNQLYGRQTEMIYFLSSKGAEKDFQIKVNPTDANTAYTLQAGCMRDGLTLKELENVKGKQSISLSKVACDSISVRIWRRESVNGVYPQFPAVFELSYGELKFPTMTDHGLILSAVYPVTLVDLP